MNESNEEQNIDFDETKVKSYFPELFMAKLVAYIPGEPSVYIGQRVLYDVKNPQSGSVFQGKIGKAVSDSRLGRAMATEPDISRMFDEIDLVDDLLSLEDQGWSEYALAQENLDYDKQRMNYILSQVSKEMLNEDRTELSSALQRSLNRVITYKVVPGGYSGFINAFKPENLDLPNLESMSAEEIEQKKLAIANQRLAYAFMKSVRVCYAQKLLDLNESKFPIVGWDMDVKSFANETELTEHEFPEKLTVIQVGSGDAKKFYVYGNGDGSEWRLREVNESQLPDVHFDYDKSIPSTRAYKMVQDQISILGAHKLSAEQQTQNIENEGNYLRYFRQVISPLQGITTTPVTEDSFIVNTEGVKSLDELLIDLNQKKEVINSRLDVLFQYKENINDPVLLVRVEQEIKLYESKLVEAEKVDFLLGDESNPRHFILQVLDDSNESVDLLEAMEIYINLQKFAAHVSDASIEPHARIAHARRRDLLSMIETQQEVIKEDCQNNNINIAKYDQAPVFLIEKMNKYSYDLSVLAGNVESASADSRVGEALSLDVVEALQNLSRLEYALTQENVSERTIESAQRFLNSPLNLIAKKFSAAKEAGDTQQMSNLVKELESLSGRAMMRIKLTRLQTNLQKHPTANASTLRQIERELEFLEVATEEEIFYFSKKSKVYAAAQQMYELDNLPPNHIVQKVRLKMEVSNELNKLEKFCDMRHAQENLDELIKYVGQGFNPQQSDDPEVIKSRKQERMALNAMIFDTKEGLDSLDLNVQNHARRSPVVDLAARYAEICSMDESSKSKALAEFDMSLDSLVAPTPTPTPNTNPIASPAARSTGKFRRLFQGILSPSSSDDSKSSTPNKNEELDPEADTHDTGSSNKHGKF